MSMSEETMRGLALLGGKDFASAKTATVLVAATLDVVCGRTAPAAVLATPALAGVDKIVLKQAHAALAAALLAAARDDADAETLEAQLADARVPAGVAKAAAEQYAGAKEQLRAGLLAHVSSVRRPRVVDVEWRLDYYLKSSAVEHVNVPVYFVKLTTVDADGRPGAVQFTCSIEELQDLIASLRDAAKQTERTASLLQ